HKARRFKLAQDLLEQGFAKPRLPQRVAKPAERRLVRRRRIERKPAEAPKRHAVEQRLLEARIGQTVPLLKQQRLEHGERLIRRPPRLARPDSRNQLANPRPVDQARDPLQPRVAPETGRKQCLDKTVLSHPIRPRCRRSESQSMKPVTFAEVSLAGEGAERGEADGGSLNLHWPSFVVLRMTPSA